MALMKLEGEIVLTSATAVGTFAGSVITMPAGRYFLNSVGSGGAIRTFLLELKNQLDSGPGGTWTVTCDDNSDTSLGKITIARSLAYTATWTSTTIRDLLGFTTNLSTGGTLTFTGANQAKYLWLPNCGRSAVMSPEASDGAIETDYTLSLGTDGTPYAFGFTKRYLDSLELHTVKGSKMWSSQAVTTNEALEQFYGDVIAYGLRVRFHRDRNVDTTFRTWVVEDAGNFKPGTVRQDWTESTESLWTVRWTVRKTT
jgi:hypothetical protein